jgi:hypothetical protein
MNHLPGGDGVFVRRPYKRYKQLRQFARAKQYLFRIGLMPKRDQDSVFEEFVNGRQYRVRGYNIRMGNEKKKVFHFLSAGILFWMY